MEPIIKHTSDLDALTKQWQTDTSDLNHKIDDSFKEMQDFSYALGYRRGHADARASQANDKFHIAQPPVGYVMIPVKPSENAIAAAIEASIRGPSQDDESYVLSIYKAFIEY